MFHAQYFIEKPNDCGCCDNHAGSTGPDLPSKPIRIISPYTAGGLGGLVPRAIGASLTEALGQQILVENVPAHRR